MNFIALIPARGGSQGLRGKNLKKVQGISLVARAILLAREIPSIKKIILSTDNEQIMQEGKRAGCDTLLKRPQELSTSETPMIKVIEHTVFWIRDVMELEEDDPFGIVLLQPTSPMRRVAHITDAIEIFREKYESKENFSGVISVSPVPEGLYLDKIYKLKGDSSYPSTPKKMIPYTMSNEERPHERLYYRNGAVIILKSNCIASLNTFIPPIIPYIIDEPMISIDSMIDLMKAEYCGRILEPSRDKSWPIMN